MVKQGIRKELFKKSTFVFDKMIKLKGNLSDGYLRTLTYGEEKSSQSVQK